MNAYDASADRKRGIARIAVAGLFAVLGLWIAWGFLPALIWAVVIAIAIDPLYLRLRSGYRWRGGRMMPPLLVTLGVAVLVLVPIAFGIRQAAYEAHDLAQWIHAARLHGVPVPGWIAALPIGRDTLAAWWQANLATPESAAIQFEHLSDTAWLSGSQLIGKGVIHRAVIFAFTLLTLFFVLRDRDAIIAQARRAGDRLLGEAGERIGVQAIRSVRGTIDGLVLVGIGEGAVMALVYVLLGVPHPLLLGALTAVAAMIPFGAAVLFAIAAILLVGQNAVGGAIAVIVIGMVVVGIADHFVRPALIGGATRLPFVWVLIGILGGVETLGLIGLFVGPATMAVLIMLWRDYQEHPVEAGSSPPGSPDATA